MRANTCETGGRLDRPRAAVRWRLIFGRAVATLLPLAASACEPAILQPEGQVGGAEKSILIDSLAIMLAIVIPTIILALGFAWWYRAGNSRARRHPDFVYSGRIELVVWAVPLMTIMLLGGVTWIGAHELDPAKALRVKGAPLEIQGVSLDWKWLFIYPEQRVAAVNQLILPAGRPVHFSLTSASVMNAFFVPQLGSMIYTMNGMTSYLNLVADTPGTYYGQSSHYSGDGFSGMHFAVHAVPDNQFANWVASTKASGPTLDKGSYAQLARQSLNVVPFTFRNVDLDIFPGLVAQKLPQAPGPLENGTSNASVSPQREH